MSDKDMLSAHIIIEGRGGEWYINTSLWFRHGLHKGMTSPEDSL